MANPSIEEVARILVDYSVDTQPGEFVVTQDTPERARYLGRFAFGTSKGVQRFNKNRLSGEGIGGTVHVAVGSGFPETGSQTRSAIHWDMICDPAPGR